MQAFRAAANSLSRREHWSDDYFRRSRSKDGTKNAILATAIKSAIIYYRMVRYKESFKPVDLKQYQEKYKAAKISYLERNLVELNIAA